MNNTLMACIVAAVATVFCIWLLRPLARHIGFVDRPGGRKTHSHDIPLIGGVALFFGFSFGLLVLSISLKDYRGLLAGVALLLLMGVVDDFKELGSSLRLIGQFLAALIFVFWGGPLLLHLGNLFFLGPVDLGIWAYPLTILLVMGFVNSMNMLDGQDGLSGGIVLGQLVLLFILAYQLHLSTVIQLSALLIVLLVIFLFFNLPVPWRKRASIFMGDSGITFLAFIVAWFGLYLAQVDPEQIAPLTILWIVALPIFDLLHVVVKRIKEKRSVLEAGRDHVHHVLHVAGWRMGVSTSFLCVLSVGLGLFGLWLNAMRVGDGWQFVLWLGALFLYSSTMYCVVRHQAREKRLAHPEI